MPAAGTAQLGVTFDPAAELARWATLRLDQDGADPPTYALLLGRGARPNMRHTADAFDQQAYGNDQGTVPCCVSHTRTARSAAPSISAQPWTRG